MPARVRGWQANRKEVADVFEKPGEEWVGTPLDADRIDPLGIAEIAVEFDEGEEVPHPHGGSGSKVLGRAGR